MITRKLFLQLIFIFSFIISVNAQIDTRWSELELSTANTAQDITYLNEIEKEAVIVLNLARLYPKKFVEYELINYFGSKKYSNQFRNSKYKASLVSLMNLMKPLEKLTPNEVLTENAKCFAIESGERGYIGHKRLACEKKNFAECCSYGMETGKEIIMQLLVDHNVASLGHRKICFDSNYKTVGIGVAPHKKWGSCSVLELSWN